jgi:16S rRNA (cytosine967-C5)-methyltransferase
MREWNARWVAYDILRKLEEHQSNSAVLLQNSLASIPNPADRALITELIMGVLRWRAKLLYVIQQFSRRSLDSIDKRVQVILLVGIYQLLFTRIPPHAAVHETVNLCKRIRMTSASSFVNGILRAVQSKVDSMVFPEGDDSKSFSVVYSHPEWLVQRWLNRYGVSETKALMQRNNTPAQVFLRVNELIATPDKVLQHLKDNGIKLEARPCGGGERGPGLSASPLFLVIEGAPQLTESFEKGEFYIHDAGIEVLGEIMSAKPGQSVLEVAAAPGGKTLQLAMRMHDQGRIVCVDSDLKRMKMWRRNIERLQIHSAMGVVSDARRLPLSKPFNLVTVDAPCSGLGVIRRHPEIKWWRSENELQKFAEVQLQILQSCAKYVDDTGSMVYSVCSFEPEETEDICKEFLRLHPEFQETARKTLFPHRDNTDGFFVVKFGRAGVPARR